MTKGTKKTQRRYTDRTLKLLWGRAAGRCAMPECRIEVFAEATDHDPIVVIGDIAHVAAVGDEGPRADDRMPAIQRNDYANLILLCKNCHSRIDGQYRTYPVHRLTDIKRDHEAWVRASLPERGRSRTGWIALVLRGDHPLDMGTIDEALAPDFCLGEPEVLRVPGESPNWQVVDRDIAARARLILGAGDPVDTRVAVFPIAPVSACISLGYHLTSRPHVTLFQHHRDERTWAWPKQPTISDDIIVSGLDGVPSDDEFVTFAWNISAVITDEVLTEAGSPPGGRVRVSIPAPSTTWLRDSEQLARATAATRGAFERAMTSFPRAREWRFFFAGPAPLGVAVGQQINPTMYPPVRLHEYRHKEVPRYRPSILLGGS
jgi:SMODS-associated and fused to various effectors sensor domain